MTCSSGRLVAGLLIVTAVTAGCAATKPSGDTAAAAGPGVTDSTITLGVLTDRTGPFAGAGTSIELGRRLYWDAQNAAGGVCGRKVQFSVKDHAYKTDQAVTAYTQIKDSVLALDELLGSPEIAALSDTLEQDKMPTMAVSWSSALLSNPYVIMTGTTYDVEMINAVDWLMRTRGLAKGAAIGHIYLDGDYGSNALAGSTAAAAANGLTLRPTQIKGTDTDMTAQVTALRNQGVKFVLLSTSSAQTASAVSVAEANGFDMSFVGSNPSFSPALLAGPARAAMLKRYHMVASTAPLSSTAAGPAKLLAEITAKAPDQLKSAGSFTVYGYAQGMIMKQILETACAGGAALTRDRLQQAVRSLTTVQTDGLIAPLVYSEPGKIPARQVFIARPDANAPGGLTQVQDLFASQLASTFVPKS